MNISKKLLETFLDLYTYDSNIEQWSLDKFKDNPPRFYRLQIIISLMKALDISSSYSDFRNGDFIQNIQLEHWIEFRKNIKDDILSNNSDDNLLGQNHLYHIQTIYYSLMRYRICAQELLSTNSGIYAAFNEFIEFSELMSRPNRMLMLELEKIDKVLLFCVNPNGLNYSKKELINRFDYPDINLNEIDFEWI